MNNNLTRVLLVAIGLLGVYLKVEYAGWVLAVGLLLFIL